MTKRIRKAGYPVFRMFFDTYKMNAAKDEAT